MSKNAGSTGILGIATGSDKMTTAGALGDSEKQFRATLAALDAKRAASDAADKPSNEPASRDKRAGKTSTVSLSQARSAYAAAGVSASDAQAGTAKAA